MTDNEVQSSEARTNNQPPETGVLMRVMEALERAKNIKYSDIDTPSSRNDFSQQIRKAQSDLKQFIDGVPEGLGKHLQQMCSQIDLTQADLLSLMVLAKHLQKGVSK